MKKYRIHPGIGIARLGNSETEFFVGPTAPGVVPLPEGPYRDGDQRLKRQAAEFRIYEYENVSGGWVATREITAAEAEITWHVHVANRKAAGPTFPPSRGTIRNANVPDRDRLVIDAGVQSVAGTNDQRALGGFFLGAPVGLGEIRTSDVGRLLALGASGTSRSVPEGLPLFDFANNDGWHDDVCDGPVSATLVIEGEGAVEADPAWLVVAPPPFAPAINNVITWYDWAVQVANEINPMALDVSEVSFTRDIYPILKRTVYLQWVSAPARSGHGNGAPFNFLDPSWFDCMRDPSDACRPQRERVFNALADPDGGGGSMPMLNRGLSPDNPTGGTAPTTLTRYQYDQMNRWRLGLFIDDWPGHPPAFPPLEEYPVEKQPWALDRAALEYCIGGPFFPGIETGYIMGQPATYGEAFRINRNLLPGDLTVGNAVPWQADFLACATLWWPAQRPNSVLRDGRFEAWASGINSYDDMVQKWWRLGFILQDGDEFVERERDLP